jgi:hypothetical protein
MIAAPLNDAECLGRLTELTRELVNDPAVIELAERFSNTDELVAWIRALPQRDDLGDPHDGPRVDACEPPQRLRVLPDDPNCFERGPTYIAVAERLDPRPTRRLATVDLPVGRHTFPLEDGVPVVLDPRVRRNSIRGAMFRANRRRNGAATLALSPEEAIDWIAGVAVEPAEAFADGPQRVRRGHLVMRGALRGRAICMGELADVAFTLALAKREAPLYGEAGLQIVESTARAVDRLDQLAASAWASAPTCGAARNAGLELRIGNTTIAPDWNRLGALGRIGARLGTDVAVTALQTKLATMGITPPVLNTIEGELNQEGYTLGPVAKPPPILGSLAALTPQALAGRWIADKL